MAPFFCFSKQRGAVEWNETEGYFSNIYCLISNI